MILRVLVLCIFVVNCKGTGVPTSQYRTALTSMTSDLAKVVKEEFLVYYKTRNESRAFNAVTKMLTPSSDIMTLEVEHMSPADQSFMCTTCRAATSILMDYIKENDISIEFTIRSFIVELCVKLKIQAEEVCEGFFDLNWPVIKYILSANNLSEHSVCGVLLQGSNCVTKDPQFDWSIEVDSNGGKVTQSKQSTQKRSKNDLTIVQITDVHFDPNYKMGALAQCNKPMCCVEDPPNVNKNKQDESTLAGKWSDYRNCDVPWDLYANTLQHIRKEHKKIDYIYYTGDVVDHAVWRTTHKENKNAMQRIYRGMKEVFGDITVFPVIGNHESQPLNQFAPEYIKDKAISTTWLYDFLAEEWSYWLPESTKETIKKGGYYTVAPRKGFRVIVLNNNDCYTFNFWILHDPKYLSVQLQWLHDTLLNAEKAGEHVHILAHVPSGAGSCHTTWAREYRKIIERFHRIIGGVFNGHTHRDEFSVIHSRDKSRYAINVAWNGGSITPYSFVNPNYRVYDVEPKTYQVVTHDTWIFNLTLANMHPDKSPHWFKEYSFAEAYGVKDLSPASLDKLLTTFAKNHNLLRKYWEHKFKRGDPSLAQGCDNDCLFKHLCEAATSQFDDMARCIELEADFKKTILGVKPSSSNLPIFSVSLILIVVFVILF